MFFILALVLVFLAERDIMFTLDRVTHYGIACELNPVARSLMKKHGVLKGLLLSVAVPTLLILGIGYFCIPFLTFVLGSRCTLLLFQLKAEKLERARQGDTTPRDYGPE